MTPEEIKKMRNELKSEFQFCIGRLYAAERNPQQAKTILADVFSTISGIEYDLAQKLDN